MDEGDNCHPVTGSSEHYALSDKFHEANSKDKRDTLMALYHCMIRHSTVRYAPFCINHKLSVSLSVEEVQTFLSLIAEERIQRELDGTTPKENASYVYTFELAIFSEYVFCLYFYLCICVLLQLKTIWSNKCTSRLY